jgi:hypothetical protein
VDEHLPEAFTIIGFAFYMQPMMMPLVSEMPAGPAGTRAMAAAVHTSLYGVAMAVYGAIGAFGASLFGPDTAGNIMLNPIIKVGLAAAPGLAVPWGGLARPVRRRPMGGRAVLENGPSSLPPADTRLLACAQPLPHCRHASASARAFHPHPSSPCRAAQRGWPCTQA